MTASVLGLAALLSLIAEVRSVYICDGGHYCAGAQECCEDGCCYPHPHQRPSPPPAQQPPYGALDIFVYNHWYFWCVVCATALLAGCAWGAWRRRARLCGSCCEPLARRSRASDRDSAGSCYVPPHYSRCSSFHRAPPPYNEVTSKPDMYPLVITYGDTGDKADTRGGGGGGGGGAASNYLMVHYFRNYIIRPPGSLSAASTAESLNSSFMCNAANEANSVVPPPYSFAGSCEEWRGGGGGGGGRSGALGSPRRALLRSLSSLTGEPVRAPPRSTTTPLRIDDAPRRPPDASPDGIDARTYRTSFLRTPSRETRYTIDDIDFDVLDYGVPGYEACLIVENVQGPRGGVSPPRERPGSLVRESDGDSWRHVCVQGGSPPRPTSPPEPEPKRAKKNRSRKTSLYMPLSSACGKRSRASPGEAPPGRSFAARAFSLSAPSTPCGSGLVPTLMTLSQKMSGSMLSSKSSRLAREESDPLLSECEEPDAGRTDGQF